MLFIVLGLFSYFIYSIICFCVFFAADGLSPGPVPGSAPGPGPGSDSDIGPGPARGGLENMHQTYTRHVMRNVDP